MKDILVKQTVGLPDGDILGNRFHDVQVTVRRTASGTWITDVLETWGNNDGRLVEQGRKSVSGQASTLEMSVERAISRAEMAGIELDYTVEALALAGIEAADQLEVNLDQP